MKIKEERKLMEKLNRGRTLSEKAYDALCNVIRKMVPGNNRLPSEDDLANNMGVSRATIREALKHLMLDGVTTTIHGKGTFVTATDMELAAEARRHALEEDFCHAVAKARTVGMSDEEIKELFAIIIEE